MNDSDKLTARGRVASLDLSYDEFVRAIIAVGEFPMIGERRIEGTIYVVGQPPNGSEWQLGQMVTITIER